MDTISDLSGKVGLRLMDERDLVYFLCNQDTVVYVGRSSCIDARIAAHKRDKEFDSVYLFDPGDRPTDLVERAFIRLFRPRHNRSNSSGPMEQDEIDALVEVGAIDRPVPPKADPVPDSEIYGYMPPVPESAFDWVFRWFEYRWKRDDLGLETDRVDRHRYWIYVTEPPGSPLRKHLDPIVRI